MKIDAPKIKSWVERIERLLAERAAINGDIKDIYAEVKSKDHDAKAIRKLIQRRAQDEGDLAEQDALLAAYTDAIAGKIKALEAIAAGASTEEAAKTGGISTGAVSALRQGRSRVQKSRKMNGTPPHDSETGEVHQPVEEIAAEILALPIEERVAAIMVVEALAKAPAVAAIIASREPPASIVTDDEAVGEMVAAKQRLDEMKRAKGLAT